MILDVKQVRAIPLLCLLCLGLVCCGGQTEIARVSSGDNVNYNYTNVASAQDGDTAAFYEEWVNQLRTDPIYMPSSE